MEMLNYTAPNATGTATLEIHPRQQKAENYLTTTEFTIGGQTVTNATIDINSPYTLVNDLSCIHCAIYQNSSTPVVDFATYNYTASSTFMDLNLAFAPILRVETLYDHAQNVEGFWGSDIWMNLDVNNQLTSELSFFVVTSVDNVLDTFGYAEVIGLGRAGEEAIVPGGSSIISNLYYNSQINDMFVSLDYSWRTETTI